MKETGQALLLIGSAKRPRSNSEALGTYLVERLRERGIRSEAIFLYRALKSELGEQALLDAVDRAGLVVLATPLYVDCLPALVTRALELVWARRRASNPSHRPRFSAIVNCGFPEARQCAPALAICRRFALEAGLEWAGGLALGGGEVLEAKPLSERGGVARNVKRALEMAADEMAAGRPVPTVAVALMAKPLIPVWLYTWMGNRGMRKRAREFGRDGDIGRRPFAP